MVFFPAFVLQPLVSVSFPLWFMCFFLTPGAWTLLWGLQSSKCLYMQCCAICLVFYKCFWKVREDFHYFYDNTYQIVNQDLLQYTTYAPITLQEKYLLFKELCLLTIYTYASFLTVEVIVILTTL